MYSEYSHVKPTQVIGKKESAMEKPIMFRSTKNKIQNCKQGITDIFLNG